ncbi:MAG: hypothetical protein ACRD3W_15875, partial [Terriglobales bacterium]
MPSPRHQMIAVTFAVAVAAALFGNLPAIASAPANGGIDSNDANGTDMGWGRLKYMQSSEGADARQSTQPDFPEYSASDARKDGTTVDGHVDGGQIKRMEMYSLAPPLPKSFVQYDAAKVEEKEMYENIPPTKGGQLTDSETSVILMKAMNFGLSKFSDPQRIAPAAQAAGQAQSAGAGNGAAEVGRDQAASAIDFCSKYLTNFTIDPSNKWNKLRDNIFVPMGILLLLPGAILAQVKAIIAAGSPVLGDVNPFEGILR